MYQISLENRKWEYLLNFQKLTLRNIFLYDFKIPKISLVFELTWKMKVKFSKIF